MVVVWLCTFWVMQALAQIIFKFGSDVPARFLPCFIFGNVFGASSIWLLMLVYKHMNPNLALGLGTGGGFIAAQAALYLIFRTNLSAVQYVAVVAVAAGMALFALGNKA